VKHRVSDVGGTSKEIGASVRSRLEAFLHSLNPSIDDAFSVRIEIFARNIALWGPKINLTAHPTDPEELAFHVCDSMMPLVLLPSRFEATQKILDLGSGAGFPGLVLAAGSDAQFTLVESRRKRASFLHVAVAEMELTNVTVESRRAEELPLGHYDLVTARAFGNADNLLALATRGLRPGGRAIIYASPAQRFSFEVERIPYHLVRRTEPVDRILAIWKRP
jgi:16S rRNA (guanine527-N7)-methyltransferase